MKFFFLLPTIIAVSFVQAQNVFPSTGNVGIGIAQPQGKLQVRDNARDYYINKAIPGFTEDSQGINYLLLHKLYTGSLIGDHHVMGRISAVRGSESSWNRKWTVDVNTSSAYESNRGSIITYNEAARLVTLEYSSERYLAIEIAHSSSLYDFSFTGYAYDAMLKIVFDQDVTSVQVYTSLDPITVQGKVGIGTMSPQAQLDVVGQIRSDALQLFEGANYIGSIGRGLNMTGGFASTPDALSLSYHKRDFVIGGWRKSDGLWNGAALYINSDNNNIGIGTITPTEKLSVNGNILAKKIRVSNAASDWPDYVFDSTYQLPPLESISSFIKNNKHLPEMPSATVVEKDGHDLGEVQKLLLKKVEELTLYTIRQNALMQKQQQNIKELTDKLNTLIDQRK